MVINDELDPHAILQVLGLTDATTIMSVRGGSDTAIWRVTQADEVYALRVFQAGKHEDWKRERLVMQAAMNAGLPVPQIVAAGTWRNYPALLLSWLPGWPVTDELRKHPWRAYQLGIIFGRTQATIHALPAPEILLQYPDSWVDWLGQSEQALQKCLRAVDHHTDMLLHLDYHPYNVLTDGKRITGVLDWRNAGAGEPRADAARTVAILRVDVPRGPRIFERIVRRIFEQGWRTGYKQQGALPKDMRIFYAWAGAVMERDLAAKRKPEELACIHQWTMKWKRKVGCL